jgi:hypothetical protein
MNKYTVILLYPDYLAENYGQEIYLAHVEADSPEDAIKNAQREAVDFAIPDENDESEIVLAMDDFLELFVAEGHVQDITPFKFNDKAMLEPLTNED